MGHLSVIGHSNITGIIIGQNFYIGACLDVAI